MGGLLAALYVLKCFQTSLSGKHVKHMIDYATAVAVINSMEIYHSLDCDSTAVQIWEFSVLKNVTWVTAAHISGSSNLRIDNEYRYFLS